jgi:DNA-binding transcriptional regulator YdaS (Cro superfamily)
MPRTTNHNPRPIHELSPTRRAIALAGGPTAIAYELDITPQAVSRWASQDQIPAKWVIPVETMILGQVQRHELRPDIYPPQDSNPYSVDPKWAAHNQDLMNGYKGRR